jgi:uncharacterized protein DUF6314
VSDYPVPDPLRYLAGAWRLARRVEDLTTGQTGSFSGTGRFSPDGTGLRYAERGELVLGSYRTSAWRAYRYRPDGAGRLVVEFDDGRYFHDLDLTGGYWEVTHPCRADEYGGAFRVLGADLWTQDWRVHGPAKNQRLFTEFRRY